jgi:hypothetical protein
MRMQMKSLMVVAASSAPGMVAPGRERMRRPWRLVHFASASPHMLPRSRCASQNSAIAEQIEQTHAVSCSANA